MNFEELRALKFHVNAIIDSIIMNDVDQEVIDVHNEAIDIIKRRNDVDKVNKIVLKTVVQRLSQYKREVLRKKENLL